MFTPGPSKMSFLRKRASSPMARPYSPANEGLKEAARQVNAGKAVERSLDQPAELQESHPISSRTPWGPSLIQISGIPSLGTPEVLNLDCA